MSTILRTLRSGSTVPRTIRSLHTSSIQRYPYKDSQDRESLKPGNTENSMGRDDEAIANSDAAFDPKKTRPESESSAADSGGQAPGDPLHTSGANQKLSKPQGDANGKSPGAGQETSKGGASGAGSGPKKGNSKKA